jgi:hypothetical protein
MQQGNKVMPFIVGVGRSGTTLLRLMLDAHPDLAIPPETHFIPQLFQENNINREEFINIISNTHTWADFRINKKDLQMSLESVRPFSVGGGVRMFYQLYAQKFNAKYYGDKTPLYLSSMSLIQRNLPEARFIHLIRDGRDVAMSYRGLWFGPGDDIRMAARLWKDRIYEGRLQANSLKYYHEIRFEDLVANTESVLREICEFIELPYSPHMLDYYRKSNERLAELGDRHHKDGSVYVKRSDRISIHALTQFPPDQERSQRWKRSMTESNQKQFENEAGQLLVDLGYETRYVHGRS